MKQKDMTMRDFLLILLKSIEDNGKLDKQIYLAYEGTIDKNNSNLSVEYDSDDDCFYIEGTF